MIATIARVSILGILLVLTAGCSRPSQRVEPLTTSLAGMEAIARNFDGYSEIEVGARHVRLDGIKVKQILLADFNGKRCLGVLTDGEKPVSLYEVKPDALEEMWSGLSMSLKPWKLQIGDVDGDGSEDLMVGVYKKARFHPVMANRPFIYGWDGKTMYPKWLGSRLSRPFTDFVLADLGSGVRIVAVEQTREGANELAVYRWDGFGVTREWNGAGSKKLTDLEATKQSIRVRSGSSTRSYIWKGNHLQIEEVGP